MSTELDPIVGNWYEHLDKGQRFVVVALDKDQRLIEAQHFDGDVEEIEIEAWRQMDLEIIDAPEDWSGPIDNVETDDTGYTETAMQRNDWNAPLEETPREAAEAWEETAPEGEQDEWGEGPGSEEPVPREMAENIELPAERRTEPEDEESAERES